MQYRVSSARRSVRCWNPRSSTAALASPSRGPPAPPTRRAAGGLFSCITQLSRLQSARAAAERAEKAETAHSAQRTRSLLNSSETAASSPPSSDQQRSNAAPSGCPGMCHGSSSVEPGEELRLQRRVRDHRNRNRCAGCFSGPGQRNWFAHAADQCPPALPSAAGANAAPGLR